jgi:hypothetical protein
VVGGTGFGGRASHNAGPAVWGPCGPFGGAGYVTGR